MSKMPEKVKIKKTIKVPKEPVQEEVVTDMIDDEIKSSGVDSEDYEESDESEDFIDEDCTDDDSTEEKKETVDQYEELRVRARELINSETAMFWDIAVELTRIQDEQIYRVWGYETWTQYVDKDLEVGIRTVQKKISVYKWFSRMPDNIQNWIKSIGWRKGELLVGIVTPENAGEWRNDISGMSVSEIETLIENRKNGVIDSGDGANSGGGEGSSSEQKEKPKKLSVNLMPAQYDNVKKAIERAAELSESDKENHNLDLICTEFMMNSLGLKDQKEYFKNAERATNTLILAVREDSEGNLEIVYDGGVMEKLGDEE